MFKDQVLIKNMTFNIDFLILMTLTKIPNLDIGFLPLLSKQMYLLCDTTAKKVGA